MLLYMLYSIQININFFRHLMCVEYCIIHVHVTQSLIFLCVHHFLPYGSRVNVTTQLPAVSAVSRIGGEVHTTHYCVCTKSITLHGV